MPRYRRGPSRRRRWWPAGLVSVFAGGGEGKAVLAYDAESGKPAWQGGNGRNSYSSPQLVRLLGVEQILVLTGEALESLDPVSGKILWKP